VIDTSGQKLEELHIVTLGFSRRIVDRLSALSDARAVGRTWLLCSHYFSKTSKREYDYAAAEFAKRAPRMRFLSLRTHAKILLFALADGRRLTVESSANLRSERNIEQITLLASCAVYTFHQRWIEGLFAESAAERGS
jgi:hypothetical protein